MAIPAKLSPPAIPATAPNLPSNPPNLPIIPVILLPIPFNAEPNFFKLSTEKELFILDPKL